MKKVIALVLASLTPVLAFAQNTGIKDLSSGFAWAKALFNNISVFIVALSVVWFLWGVFQNVVRQAGDEEARKKAHLMIIQGILGIAVMVSVYGLVYFVTNSIGLNNSATLTPPTLNYNINN
ncbi:MAG: hypothetical protein PHS95_03260 [Candidatus Pacebacteria bacterium]|nr:hypothetical protein [Candidatus Paceibacterota bacterium]